MNWGRIGIAGVAGGVAAWLVNFVLHGVIMASAYQKYPIFIQEEGNPIWFLLVSVCIGIPYAILYAKTLKCWGPGVAGGAMFGGAVGLVLFFQDFYLPLVMVGFPYYLGWCWGGINMIISVVYGVVAGLLYKE